MKDVICFSDIREELVKQIESRSNSLKIDEPVSLLDGFINSVFSSQQPTDALDLVSSKNGIRLQTLPMVMLLGNETGKIYFFSYRALMENKD